MEQPIETPPVTPIATPVIATPEPIISAPTVPETYKSGGIANKIIDFKIVEFLLASFLISAAIYSIYYHRQALDKLNETE